MPDVEKITGEDTLASFTVELHSFLKARGYGVSDDFPQRFFELAGASGLVCDKAAEEYGVLFETLAVKSPSEYASFADDYEFFVKHRKSVVVSNSAAHQIRLRMQAQENADAEARQHSQRAEKLSKKLSKMEQEAAVQDKPAIGSKKKLTQLERDLSSLSKPFNEVFGDSGYRNMVKDIPKMARHEAELPSQEEMDAMKSEMKAASKKAMKCSCPMEMLSLIDSLADTLSKIGSYRRNSGQDSIEQTKRELEEARRSAEKARARFEELVEKMNSEALSQIHKAASNEHRKEFGNVHAAVRSDFAGEVGLDMHFDTMTADDRERIAGFIRENARKFKTRMTRNIRTSDKHAIDMPATCKKACATMGVPLELKYIKPKRNKAKLLMFLDVSGSCKEASEMMLVFMHAMREVFPGGCRTYAFVNSLYDISSVFDSVDAEHAASAVLSQIPTRGVYSDYNAPFSDFVRNKINEVTKDTIVFFIGDARNNRNPSSEENVKAIARKAKRAYWVNTEHRSQWNHADSIMGIYAKYMTRVCQATTPAELIGFLTELK